MGQLGFQVGLLAVAAQFGLLISLLLQLFRVFRQVILRQERLRLGGFQPRYSFDHLESLDIHKPPVSNFVFNKVPYYFCDVDSPME